jgi:hypothetical protein
MTCPRSRMPRGQTPLDTGLTAAAGNDLSSVADAASEGIAVGGRVLVTGGGGLIGSRLVDALPARGDQVTAIDTVVTAIGVPSRIRAQVREHPRFGIDGVDLCGIDLSVTASQGHP